MKPKVILAGGSGFVGQALASQFLTSGCEVVILTRQPTERRDGVTEVQWDGRNEGNWVKTLEGAEAVINLTGKTVNCRHTPENKREIVESRVNSVRVLGHAIESASTAPKVFIQASAVGIYQDRGDVWSDEDGPHGSDFMAQVCEQWEGAFNGIDALRTRKVILRIGVVLGGDGGLLEVLGKVTRWFLGGHVGNGRQFMSWIHIADLARMFLRAVEDEKMNGVFNATAPNPVRNSEFMRELRRVLHRPWSPPIPEFAVRVGSIVMQTEAELALVSQRCAPQRFLDHGFQFEFSELPAALQNIYSKM